MLGRTSPFSQTHPHSDPVREAKQKNESQQLLKEAKKNKDALERLMYQEKEVSLHEKVDNERVYIKLEIEEEVAKIFNPYLTKSVPSHWIDTRKNHQNSLKVKTILFWVLIFSVGYSFHSLRGSEKATFEDRDAGAGSSPLPDDTSSSADNSLRSMGRRELRGNREEFVKDVFEENETELSTGYILQSWSFRKPDDLCQTQNVLDLAKKHHIEKGKICTIVGDVLNKNYISRHHAIGSGESAMASFILNEIGSDISDIDILGELFQNEMNKFNKNPSTGTDPAIWVAQRMMATAAQLLDGGERSTFVEKGSKLLKDSFNKTHETAQKIERLPEEIPEQFIKRGFSSNKVLCSMALIVYKKNKIIYENSKSAELIDTLNALAKKDPSLYGEVTEQIAALRKMDTEQITIQKDKERKLRRNNFFAMVRFGK